MACAAGPTEGDLDLARVFVRALRERCPGVAFDVTLYGSRARGEASEESDLDLFVALVGEDPGGRIKASAREIACELTLAHGLLVSVFVASGELCRERSDCAFFQAVRDEGVALSVGRRLIA